MFTQFTENPFLMQNIFIFIPLQPGRDGKILDERHSYYPGLQISIKSRVNLRQPLPLLNGVKVRLDMFARAVAEL